MQNQEYVRAQLENTSIDASFQIDSFTVCVIAADTCKYKEIANAGNKINDAIRNMFKEVKQNDMVIFKKIIARRPDGSTMMLSPVFVIVNE